MEKIGIHGVPETMLQTLYARARESQKQGNYINDEKAVEIVSRMDYDFSLAKKDSMMSNGVIARTILLDDMVRDYLQRHKNPVVINLACGLDTRCYRNEGLYSKWYNLDLPETIEVRSRFLTEQGPIYQIARSAMDAGWADAIEPAGEETLIIMEGLTMYLPERDVKRIFEIIAGRFQKAMVFVETMSPFAVKHIKENSIEGSQAKFVWGVKNGEAFERLAPGFQSVREVSLAEGMKVFLPVYHVHRMLGKLPFVRNISNRILVLERV